MNDAMTNEPPRDEIRRRFLELDTSNVADVLDELGLHDQGLSPDFAPRPADAGKLAGWAYTVQGQMTPYDHGGGDPDKMRALEEVRPGCVTVWAGDGEGVCYFGELISIGMQERGCTGALVDGGVRDIAWIARRRFPVYSRYRTPIQSIGRWKVTGWDVPVSVAGATSRLLAIVPGDFILADDDGALSIPAGVVGRVLERAEEMGRREQDIRSELSAGLSLPEALAKFGHV